MTEDVVEALRRLLSLLPRTACATVASRDARTECERLVAVWDAAKIVAGITNGERATARRAK